MNNKVEIPIYVRRCMDLLFDTNGYPHNEKNRQTLYAETVKLLSEDELKNINNMALADAMEFEDNAYSNAESSAFRYCEENGLLQTFKRNFETGEYEEDDLPSECYDKNFFKDVNSPWPESKC